MYKLNRLLAITACALLSSVVYAQGAMIGGELLRDPTRPPSVSADIAAPQVVDVGGASFSLDRSNYVLSFIRTGGSAPIAVINNMTLSIGDEIDGVRVLDIRNGEVVVSAENQEYVLTTFARPVREPVQ